MGSSTGRNDKSTGNIPERKVREFQPIFLKPEVKNLVIGSSLVKRIVDDNSIPTDIGIHAYPGSTTEEKHSVLTKYPEKQLKTVAIQDGTNSILKNEKESIDALFEGYHTLVREVHSKFSPDKILLCEVPPIRASRANEAANQRIQQYNEKMKHFCSENVQELKTVLVPLAATMRTMDNYNALLYDDIHFNDHLGLPLLKNTLLSFLLLTSDGNLKVTGQQSHWRRNQYYNDRRYTNRSNQNFNQQPFRFTNNEQSYNYMRSF